jgi:type II restriction enzyme
LSPINKGLIQIDRVDLPEGPIWIKRCDPSKGGTFKGKKSVSISSQMIWRLANAIKPNQPINVDRILGASYNTRSVLEALLAHSPQFYYCYPGRIESINNKETIKEGHKHLLWNPDNPHENGIAQRIKTDIVISEIPTLEAYYDSLVLPSDFKTEALDIEIKRRHAQIQIALYFIGKQLGFRTWIAQNDKGILYQNKKLGEFEGIIAKLDDENLIRAHKEAIKAALLIDCIWFKNGRLMPAVMEIEHSTGVTSGLTRMKNFYDRFPPFPTRYVIVAADEDRQKVIREATKPQFKELDSKFFPYSAVEELYALCQKRKLKGVTEEFLDCYMEPIMN